MAKRFHKSIKQKQEARRQIRQRAITVAERNKEIINLRKLGGALEDIGDKYGISKERVRQIIEAYNVTVPADLRVPDMIITRTKSVIEERKEQVKSLLEKGKTSAEIAVTLGISGTLLVQTLALLRKDGVNVPVSDKCGKIDQDIARRMRKAGATLKTIADRFGVTIPSVQEILTK